MLNSTPTHNFPIKTMQKNSNSNLYNFITITSLAFSKLSVSNDCRQDSSLPRSMYPSYSGTGSLHLLLCNVKIKRRLENMYENCQHPYKTPQLSPLLALLQLQVKKYPIFSGYYILKILSVTFISEWLSSIKWWKILAFLIPVPIHQIY